MREGKHPEPPVAASAKTIPFPAAPRRGAKNHREHDIEPEDFASLWEWVVDDASLNARAPAPRDCMWDWVVDDAVLSTAARRH